MKRLASIAALTLSSLFAVACHDKTSASCGDGSLDGAATASAPASSVAPALRSPPDLSEPRVTLLSARRSSIVDVVAGRSPDAEHPAGTVYVASVLDNDRRRGEARLFEWDVATTSALDAPGHLLYVESDKEDLGKTTTVRIAAGGDQLFSAVTLEPGGRSYIQKATNVGHPRGTGFVRDSPPMRNVSLETDGRWLAVAYELPVDVVDPGRRPRSGVLLYDAFTMQNLATFPLRQSREVGADAPEGARGHDLARERKLVRAAEPAQREAHGVDSRDGRRAHDEPHRRRQARARRERGRVRPCR